MVYSIVIITLSIYAIALFFIFLYSLSQASLIIRYLKHKNKHLLLRRDESYLPLVTIQLPIYNELYVVERLIDNICGFDYPKDKFEIQVLDDSTDETSTIIKNRVETWKQKGITICHIHRADRKGYKAGALENGLISAKGEYVAIFDSDFLPHADFLKQTIPYFINSNVGMVQTKWGHLNRDYSLLTKLQAFGLDAHFTIEQVGRNYKDGFINFNGTAGVWRKTCIIDAGNWQPDTLTEDLDLSYRAQLKDWKFVYLENVESPAELPPVMSALKNQQYRWTKGGAESAKKHIYNVFKSKKNIHVKWHGIMHLLNSAVFLSILICSILSVPLLFIKVNYPEFKNLFVLASFFLLSFIILSIMYYVSLWYRIKNKLLALCHLIISFPIFLSISMGLSLHNGIAVIEGYVGRKTPFIRTPKFNLNSKKDLWESNAYIKTKLSLLNYLELVMSCYFAFGVYKGFAFHDYGFTLFHTMLTIGFFTVFCFSVQQHFKRKTPS